MKTNKLWAVVVCVAFCGCATIAPDLSDTVGVTNRGLVEVMKTARIEHSKPEEAKRAYDAFLASKSVPAKPYPYYQKLLEKELQRVAGSEVARMDPEAAWGVPEAYDRQIRAVARARMGLARLALQRSDWPTVESQAKQALEAVNKKALSPLVMATEGMVCYELLRQAYEKQGRVGKERLARLNGDLLKAYLSSKQGKSDFYASKAAEEQSMERVAKADGFVKEINSARIAAADARFNQAMGALNQVSSQFQSYAVQHAAAKGRPITPQMQMNKMLTDFNAKLMAMNPDYKKGMDMASAMLSPLSNVAAGQQLVNPDYGQNAPLLIKSFATGIAELSGSDQVKKSAQLVSASIDGVTAARGGSPEQIDKALTEFATSFQALQKDAEPIVAKGS